MDEEQLAAVFTEWERQYREDPAAFATAGDQAALTVDDYGHRAARTFLRLQEEIAAR